MDKSVVILAAILAGFFLSAYIFIKNAMIALGFSKKKMRMIIIGWVMILLLIFIFVPILN